MSLGLPEHYEKNEKRQDETDRRLTNPEAAYRSDATFRAVTDGIGALLETARLTPAEVRAAAMLACIHHEQRSTRGRVFP